MHPPRLETRRRVLLGWLGLAVGGGAGAASRQEAHFRGTRAGEPRVVDGIRLCWCPPGRFVMGSPPNEPGHRPDEAQVEVTISRGFWMGTFETTQGQWTRVMGNFPDRPPTPQFGLGADVPVYWINYEEATAWCVRATERAAAQGLLPAGWAFRLPTEAQWEYACRAGTTSATAFGGLLTRDQANLADDAATGGGAAATPRRAVPVGRYPPNAWGLCDMHGNIFEWCRDWYHARLPGGTDPDLSTQPGVQNRDGTYSRCRRGGAWNDPPIYGRSAFRLRYEPDRRSDHIGFRVALTGL